MNRFLLVFTLLLLLLTTRPGHTTTPVLNWSQCAQLHKDGYYQPAADCYIKVANRIEVDSETPERLRVQKGYLYREACKNLEQAAQQSQHPELSAYLRERAILLLRQVLQNKWIPKINNKRRGRVTKAMLATFLEKVQYTSLGISTGHAQSSIQITGYQYQSQNVGTFNQKLRPGRYNVTVVYPQQKPKVRVVILQPNKPLVLTFVERSGIPAISWVGYTVGSAAILGGGILLGLGIYQGVASTNCYNDANCAFVNGEITYNPGSQATAADNRSAYGAYQQRAILFGVLGGITLATGVVLLAIGGTYHARTAQQDAQQRERVTLHSPLPLTTTGSLATMPTHRILTSD